MMKIGVMFKGLPLTFKESVIFAKDLGASGIQPFVTSGEFSPLMTKDERREIKKFIKDNGLELASVCSDFGGGIFTESDNEGHLHRVISMIDLAVDLGTNIVTSHIGGIHKGPESPEYQNSVRSVRTIGKYCESIGVDFATETGKETAEELKTFLDTVNCKNVKANIDPANLVMCIGEDPIKMVKTMGIDRIPHTHIKDGIKTGETSYEEKRLGEGDVPFIEYLAALRDIGYDGYLTIERGGEDRIAEVKIAYDYVKELLKKIY
ncbi:MAG: sugar phosphate isomerase/epimerase [Clostridia bacterium]|nr:sugar phosphate isomerase/epimerase [Clostridia bacterium]